jgi:hypothetical protein
MRTTLLPAAFIAAGCATTLTPNFQAERDAINNSTEVACLLANAPVARDEFPREYAIAQEIIRQRNATCTPEMIVAGVRMILAQEERETRIAAMQSQERHQSANNAADRVMRGLMGFAAGYAIGTALQPPPPRPTPPQQLNCVANTNVYGTTYMNCH